MDVTGPGGMSPGTHLNRMMDGLGFRDDIGDKMGIMLDKAIGNDLGVARNMFDLFSPLSTSQLDKMMGQGFAAPGFCPRPHDNYGHHWGVSKHTHYDREKINVYREPNLAGMFGKKDVMIDGKKIDVGNDWGVTPKQLETKILTDPNFRAKIESQVGGRIVLDGNADGNITIAKKVPHPMMPFHNHVHNHVGNMLGRLLGGPLGGMLGGLPGGLPGMPGGGLGGPMGQVLNNLAKFLGGGFGGPQQAGQGGPGGAGGAGQAGGAQGPDADTQELQSILKNPNLSFEAKLALFTGKFIEKKQKEMEAKMNELTAAQGQGKSGEAGGAGKAGGGGGGGLLGGILGGGGGGGGLLGGILGGGGGGGLLGGILGGGGGGGLLGGILGGGGLGSLLQMGGGLIGGMYGGPIGASLGSSIGGALGGAVGGGGGQAGGAAGGAGGAAGGAGGAGKGSQSASEQKLQTELTAITQAFNRMVEAMNNCMKTVSDMGLSSARLIR